MSQPAAEKRGRQRPDEKCSRTHQEDGGDGRSRAREHVLSGESDTHFADDVTPVGRPNRYFRTSGRTKSSALLLDHFLAGKRAERTRADLLAQQRRSRMRQSNPVIVRDDHEQRTRADSDRLSDGLERTVPQFRVRRQTRGSRELRYLRAHIRVGRNAFGNGEGARFGFHREPLVGEPDVQSRGREDDEQQYPHLEEQGLRRESETSSARTGSSSGRTPAHATSS